ncbi:MAG: PEGA domain-containing protein [Candidatus Kerfeldbacteria bacterium]
MLFWFFVIISLPIAIFLIAYTAGYRFDSQTNSVIGTSALALHTEPKDAIVILNGEPQSSTTPFIETLLPGEYSIEIRKEGYRSWKKALNFDATRSVIFPDIVLFGEHTPRQRDAAPSSVVLDFVALSQEYRTYYRDLGWDAPKELMVQEGPMDLIVDEMQKSSYIVPSLNDFDDKHRINGVVTAAVWNKDDALTYAVGVELWVLNSGTGEFILLNRQSTPILDVSWHPDGGYVVYSDKNGLFVIEIDPRGSRQIWQLSELPSPSDISVASNGSKVTFASDGIYYDLDID